LLLTGHAELTIDAKGRLAIPSKYRAQAARAASPVSDEPPTVPWVAVPWPNGALRLYPAATFERLAAAEDESLTPASEEAELEITLFGLAETVEPDKAGRVVLPKGLVKMVGLPNEVVVIGVRNRIEVRDRATWQAEREQRFRALPELVAKVDAKRRGL
jgi:MraZ protein